MPNSKIIVSANLSGLNNLLTELGKRGDPKRVALAARIALSKGGGIVKRAAAATAPADSAEAIGLLNRESAWKVFVSKYFRGSEIRASIGPDSKTLYPAVGTTKKSMKALRAAKGYGQVGGGSGARAWVKGGAKYFRTAASVANASEYGNSKTPATAFFTRAWLRVKVEVEEAIKGKLEEFVRDPDKTR
jgi:hypothetical protein